MSLITQIDGVSISSGTLQSAARSAFEAIKKELPEKSRRYCVYEAVIEELKTVLKTSELHLAENDPLKDVKTCDLVDELKTREGVQVKYAEPYEAITVDVDGPAVVLVVTD